MVLYIIDFMGLKLPLWLISKTFKKKKKKKHRNEEEKYILAIVWIVGLIKHSSMDFTNIKLQSNKKKQNKTKRELDFKST